MNFPPIQIVRRIALFGIIAAMVPRAEVAAQSEPGATVERGAEDASTIVYGAEYFGRYNVTTATDMLRRIPGASAVLDARRTGQTTRGFGSAGDQILINGERLAGKANQIMGALDRIQASQVIRIELIRGTSGALDVRSEGLIFNIVLSGELDKASGSWDINGQFSEGGAVRPEATVSYGGDWKRLTYFMSLKTGTFSRRRLVDDRFFGARDGVLFERRDEQNIARFRRFNLTTNLTYKFERGDTLRLNGLVEQRRFTISENSDQFTVAAPAPESFLQTEVLRFKETGPNWEVGGDYERKTGPGGRLKVLFVHTYNNQDQIQKQHRISGGTDVLIIVSNTGRITRETILRPSYKWNVAKNQNLEIGIEGALNSLDTALDVVVDDAGVLVPIDIFNADSRVEEIRIEGFSTHIWKPWKRLSIESAVNEEYSRIRQTGGDIGRSRRFFFVKPRLDLRFDITPSRQLRLKVERTVSQLNFADFVSTFDEEDDRADSGNPELVPEKAWEFELAYELRLAEDGGVLKARLFYNDVGDKLDKVAGNIGGDRSAAGNVGGAFLLGAELSGSLRLAQLGVPDAVVTASFTRQRSRLTDAFTGLRRRFNRTPNYSWTVGFRHDTQTAMSLSYGFDFNGRGRRSLDDIDEHRISDTRPGASTFAEAKVLGGLTLRFEVNRLLRDKATRQRIRYVGNKVNEIPSRNETRVTDVARTYTLSLKGNF